MKRILFISSMILITTVAALSQNNNNQGEFAEYTFTIKGFIAGATGKQITLTYGYKELITIKTLVEDNGNFSLSGSLDRPYYNGQLRLGEWNPQAGNNLCQISLEEGSFTVCAPSGNLSEATVWGGKAQNELNIYQASLRPIRKELDRLDQKYNEAKTEEEKEAAREIIAPVLQQYEAFIDEYIKTHPDSYISAENLSMKRGHMSYEELKTAYYSLSERVRLYGGTQEIENELITLGKTQPGADAPDFTTTDINNKVFTLSALKGKVVILDFWASWCVPCRKSNPHMKTLYERYHDKGLELVYISSDDNNPTAWRKAVEKDGLQGEGFHHVLRGFKVDRKTGIQDHSNDIGEKYAVHYLPTKYLIDREGKIICKIGEGEENKLDLLLAEYLE